VFKPAQLIALLKARRARHHRWTIAVAFEGEVEKTQADTCDQHRGNGNQRHRALVAVELQAQHRTFVPAIEPVNALEGWGIDVPSIAGDVHDPLHPAVEGRMKTMIHAGG